MNKLKVLDLFSGIGGFSLGLERTGGFETVAFCEIDPYCRKVLKKHWPEVPIYEDVRTLNYEGSVDVISGGFPCQDISNAGRGEGLEGEKSKLWFEFKRIIDEMGPSWAIIENVPSLRSKGLSTVLQNLSEIGYDAEWHCIPASYLGAPHRRDRIWIISYPNRQRCETGSNVSGRETGPNFNRRSERPIMAYSDIYAAWGLSQRENEALAMSGIRSENVCNSTSKGFPDRTKIPVGKPSSVKKSERPGSNKKLWSIEPRMGRVANGIPKRVDRLKGLGNAVIPQIPEIIGDAILQSLNVPKQEDLK